MKMLLTITLLVSLLATRVAGKSVDIYQVTIGGNATLGSDCANRGQTLGPELMNTFVQVAPSVTSYSGNYAGNTNNNGGNSNYNGGGRRHLKEAKHRQLGVDYCKDTNCNLKRNFDFCYWNSCGCNNCGHRRMLVQSGAYGGDIQSALKAMQDAVTTAASQIPNCSLALVFNKGKVDSSTL
jgi:hypothetical protein